MLKLIIGVKGTGKTKTLIEMVNTASAQSNGSVVCIEKGTTLDVLPIEEYKEICDLFDEGVYDAISLERCVSMRTPLGSPCPDNVRKQSANLLEKIK